MSKTVRKMAQVKERGGGGSFFAPKPGQMETLATQATTVLVCQKSLKHLCSSLSRCNMEMSIAKLRGHSNIAKGKRETKGSEIFQAFQGLCLRL